MHGTYIKKEETLDSIPKMAYTDVQEKQQAVVQSAHLLNVVLGNEDNRWTDHVRNEVFQRVKEDWNIKVKGKGLPQQAEVAQGVPGRLTL